MSIYLLLAGDRAEAVYDNEPAAKDALHRAKEREIAGTGRSRIAWRIIVFSMSVSDSEVERMARVAALRGSL